jgi:hypothetical protein
MSLLKNLISVALTARWQTIIEMKTLQTTLQSSQEGAKGLPRAQHPKTNLATRCPPRSPIKPKSSQDSDR